MKTVPNQDTITLNRHKVNMKEKGPSWTVFYDYNLNKAVGSLNKSGLAVYLFLCEQIPHYYDEIPNINNKSQRRFAFSPEAVANAMGISKDSVRNGWREVQKVGYVKCTGKHLYYFTDDLNEEKKYEIATLEKEDNGEIQSIEEIRETLGLPPKKKYDWE